jgi:segregation and condensation protein B
MEDLEELQTTDIRGQVEALLLVSSDAVPATELAQAIGASPMEVEGALADLAAEYADANRGFQLREVPGGWRFFTHPAHHDLVESYVLSWESARLSQAALETLAVIAYHQPVTREGVKAVRGVNSDGVIASLRSKGLVRELGREGGRVGAIMYGTTKTFLESFGLRTLKDLPPLEDFAPDEQSKQFIRERLSGSSIASTLEETTEDIESERDLLDGYDDEADAEGLGFDAGDAPGATDGDGPAPSGQDGRED